jgi:hypothetical protein
MHSRPLTLIFMVSALFLLSANAAAQDMELPAKGEYKLTGTVVNSVTGEPIRRALVRVSGQAVLTDAEGKFEVDGLLEGTMPVEVRKPGFLNEQELRRGRSFSNNQVSITADTAPITLKLVPEGIIYGRVESNGEPINNFPIKLITSQVIGGRRQWVHAAATSSNDDGEFRIADLPAGTYYLSAGPSWTERTVMTGNSSGLEQGYAETFYPQGGELVGAAAIKISPGDQTEADFSLKSAHLYKIEGFVRGASGQGANLQFINAEGEVAQFPVHYNPATGAFQTMAPAGAYTLKAQGYTTGAPMTVASMPLNISADVAGIQMVLAPTISIPVNVRKDAVQPVNTNSSFTTSGVDMNGRSFTLSGNDGSYMNISLMSREQWLHNQQYTSTYRIVGETPMMEIENVEPGRYMANISVGQQWYVELAQCGSIDLLREELTVGIGVQPPPISMVIRNDPAEIRGTVSREGQPGQGHALQGQTGGGQAEGQTGDGESGDAEATKATVLLVPEGRPLGTKEVEVGRDGNYFIPGLAPGDYDVLALDHAGDVEYTNPEILRLYLPRAQHIVLQANQKQELNLELVKVE